MAVRRWQVPPDPDTGIVPREAIVQAFMDAEAIQHIAGGVVTSIVGRHPTDLPGEMVTTSVVFEWKDRTDAKPSPERAGDVVPQQAAAPPARQPAQSAEDELDDDPTPEDLERALEIRAPEELVGDGLDVPPETEDLSSVPTAMR